MRGSVVVAGAVAIGGVALILGNAPAGGTSIPGDLLVAGGMLAWVVYLTTSKLARSRLSTLELMAVMSTAACAVTVPISLVVSGPGELVDLSVKGWVLVVLLALITGVTSHGLIAWAQRRVAVGTISILQLAQPALASLWAATLLDESVRGVQVAGMAIVLGAVGSVALRSTRR
ncbi:MAG TPA: DMT family transporter [Acidimicrobiales bacterium]